jgi:hypothetical protein
VNTHQLFDALCAQFSPRLMQFRDRVVTAEPAALFSSEEERAMTVIMTQTLRDLAEARPARTAAVARRAIPADNDLDTFLGITGRL